MLEFWGLAAIILTVGSYAPYIVTIFRRETRPHIFSYTLWALPGFVVLYGQLEHGAGAGAWAMGASAFMCAFIALLALRYGTWDITASDKSAFWAGLAGLGLWIATKDVLLAMIMAGIIDTLAFYPTFRKSWTKPWEENIYMYILHALGLFCSFAALSEVNFATVFNSAVFLVAELAFIALVLGRRFVLAKRDERSVPYLSQPSF